MFTIQTCGKIHSYTYTYAYLHVSMYLHLCKHTHVCLVYVYRHKHRIYYLMNLAYGLLRAGRFNIWEPKQKLTFQFLGKTIPFSGKFQFSFLQPSTE